MQLLDISSRDNPLVVRVRKLSQDNQAYRQLGQVWLEGDHLLQACLARGGVLNDVLVSQSGWDQGRWPSLLAAARRVVRLPDALFKGLSGLESPAQVGALVDLPPAPRLDATVDTVVLDRVQDAGNVGSILRSAAAFGVRQVVALKGTAALWSPKVLRAGMGAHFGLRLVEGLAAEDLEDLPLPLVATSSHAPHEVHRVSLPSPMAWVLGHEGQGVGERLLRRCAMTVRIPQPGGEESLNVAAAAAVCLYEAARQRDVR